MLLAQRVSSPLGLALLPRPRRPSPRVPCPPSEVVQRRPDPGQLALVFNVGAGFEPATAILDMLAEQHQRATFFVMGWWAERHPDVLRQIADGGHEIASHGHSIFDLTQASTRQVRADLIAPTPRSAPSPAARPGRCGVRQPATAMRACAPIAADLGYRPILWTVDSGDWTPRPRPKASTATSSTAPSNGAIVVLHFDSPTTRGQHRPGAVRGHRHAARRRLPPGDDHRARDREPYR